MVFAFCCIALSSHNHLRSDGENSRIVDELPYSFDLAPLLLGAEGPADVIDQPEFLLDLAQNSDLASSQHEQADAECLLERLELYRAYRQLIDAEEELMEAMMALDACVAASLQEYEEIVPEPILEPITSGFID